MMFIGFYFSELLLHITFFVIGLSFALRFKQHEDLNINPLLFSSYFVGQFIAVLIVFTSFLVGLPPTVLYLWIFTFALIALLLAIIKNLSILKNILIYLSFLIVCSAAIVFSDLTILSFDSYRYVLLGKQIALGENKSSWLLGYSFSLPALQSLGIAIFKLDLFRSLVPVSSLLSMFLIVHFLFNYFRRSAIILKLNVLLVVASFITCYFVFFGSFYLIPNMLVGCWLVVVVIASTNSYFKSDFKWLIFFMGLTSFSLARVEGFVFSLVFLPIFFSQICERDDFDNKINVYFGYYFFLVVVSIWFMYLRLSFPEISGDFYTDSKLSMLIVLVLFAGIIPFLSQVSIVNWLLTRSVSILFVLLIVACISLALVYDERVQLNASAFFLNLTETGSWGSFWNWFFAPALIAPAWLYLRGSENKNIFRYLMTSVSFVLFLFLIFFFRENPLRAGFGDSSNRMMLHIFPTLLLVYSLVVGLLSSDGNSKPKLP